MQANSRLTCWSAAESAEAKRLHDELSECKSAYASLEAAVAEAERVHTEAHSAIEAKYMSQVSSLGDELQGVVTAGHTACQAAFAQPEGPASASEVVSKLRGIPRHLEQIAPLVLSTEAHMVLVIVGMIYTDLYMVPSGGNLLILTLCCSANFSSGQ